MSQRQEQKEEIRSASEVARQIAGSTIPGKTNAGLITSLEEASDVVDSFIEQTNDWFEIVDVRVYRDDKVGIPCKYRWTVKRWVTNDMDQWFLDNGWDRIAHLKADSREHRENEMKARYRKEIEGYIVYVNAYVEFTNDVFEAMQEGRPIKAAREKRERAEKAKDIRDMKRGN